MEFFEVIRKRYSARGYLSTPVEQVKLQQILEAARLAPTACNMQSFRVVVINTDGRREELKKIYPGDWMSEAPLVLAVCSVVGQTWIRRDKKNYGDVDAAIVMDHIILAATALGLGTCWIASFQPQALKDIFQLEENLEPIVLTPLGYPSEAYVQRTRKPLEDLVIYR